MESRISATELARRVGDILGRIRFRRDSFVVERNGEPVARLGPLPWSDEGTLSDALSAWVQAPAADPDFAADLERVNRADRAPRNPWA